MSRIWHAGAEIDVRAAGIKPDGGYSVSGAGTVIRDTAVKRTGQASWKCTAPAGAYAEAWTLGIPELGLTANATYFCRGYFKSSSAAPSAALTLLSQCGTINAQLQTDGKIKLATGSTPTATGSASAGVVNDGAWHRIELKATCDGTASNWTSAELRLDGVTVATWTGSVVIGSNQWDWGVFTAVSGTTQVWNVDDIAINDDQNGAPASWCGEGGVILMTPVSDNARGAWTAGAGGTTNLWDAVNNTPPVGASDLGGSNTSQIRNKTNTNPSSCDLNLPSYTEAGVPAGATIDGVQVHVCDGEDPITGTKTGACSMVSNPAIAERITESFGDDLIAQGTYLGGWTWHRTNMSSAPSVTVGTAPVIRMRCILGATTSRAASVCFLGAYVGYSAADVADNYPVVQTADTKSGQQATDATAWSIPYPSNLAAGDLILFICSVDGAASFSSASGTGWSVFNNTTGSVSLGIAAKIADGTESGTNFTATQSAAEQGNWRCFRITGWYGSGLPTGGVNYVAAPPHGNGLSIFGSNAPTNTSTDPPSLNPTNFGAEDVLWICAIGIDGVPAITSYPANMPDLQTFQNAGAAGTSTSLGIAMSNTATVTFDPAAWTWGTTGVMATAIIGIRPAAVAATTKVSSTRILQYGVAGKVAATRALQYSVAAKVAATRTLQYSLEVTVSGTRTLQYTVKKTIPTTRTLNYTVIGHIAAARTLQYTVISRVTTARVLQYTVRKTITDTRALQYTVKKTINNTRTLQFSLAGKVAATRVLMYSLAVRTSATRALQYSVLSRTSATRTLNYTVKKTITNTRTLQYSVPGRIAATRALQYTVLKRITDTRTLLHSLSVKVTNTRTLQYTIVSTGKVSSTRALQYGVRTTVVLARTLQYQINQKATATRSLLYTVKKTITNTRTLNYTMVGRINASRTVLYTVIGRISTLRALQYSVNMRATATRALQYTVRKTITTTRSLQYNVQQRISLARTLQYTVKKTINATRTLQYTIIALGRVTATRTLLFKLAGKVSGTRTLQYSLAQRVALTRTLQYTLLTRTTATRQLRYSLNTRATATRTLQYTMRGRIVGSRQLQYTLRQRIAATRQLQYSVLAKAATTVTLQYTLNQTVYSTQTLQYAINVRVAAERQLLYNIPGRTGATCTLMYAILRKGTTLPPWRTGRVVWQETGRGKVLQPDGTTGRIVQQEAEGRRTPQRGSKGRVVRA